MTTITHVPSLPRVPRRYAPILSSFVMSTAITAVTSGMITAINTGFTPGYPDRWLRAWTLAWMFAFPTVALSGPFVRKIVERLVAR